MSQLCADEIVVFADALHPTHTVTPVGCWPPIDTPAAAGQSSGRDRLNIYGDIDLETGQTIMKNVLTVDALSTITLLTAVPAKYPGLGAIHVSLDKARCHRAKKAAASLSRPGCPIKLHAVPAYRPHLNPIERSWGLMRRYLTRNKCYALFKDFVVAMPTFLRSSSIRNWATYCAEGTDNFRIIGSTGFRITA